MFWLIVCFYDYAQCVIVASNREKAFCTVGGRSRFPSERVSRELSGCTKPLTPMACSRDPSHGLSETGPLHLSTHPLWNQPPWPTIAMQNTPPALNTVSIILNHFPLPYSLSLSLFFLAHLPCPLLSFIVNKQLSLSGNSKCKLGTNGSTWTVLITWYVFHESQMVWSLRVSRTIWCPFNNWFENNATEKKKESHHTFYTSCISIQVMDCAHQ